MAMRENVMAETLKDLIRADAAEGEEQSPYYGLETITRDNNVLTLTFQNGEVITVAVVY